MPIVVPGRRIGTAYSSSGAVSKRMQRAKRTTYASLMLTSMVDMFTILVLYLIQQFNSTGQILFIDPTVKLPEAHRASAAPGNPPVITIGRDEISVQGKPVEVTENLKKEGQWEAAKLEEALKQLRDVSTSVANATNGQVATESAQGVVMIQADVSVPYMLVKKVMFIASKAGFESVDFAVTQIASAQ